MGYSIPLNKLKIVEQPESFNVCLLTTSESSVNGIKETKAIS